MCRDYKKEMALPVEREQAIFHFGVSDFIGETPLFAHISWTCFCWREFSVRAKDQTRWSSRGLRIMRDASADLDGTKVFSDLSCQ